MIMISVYRSYVLLHLILVDHIVPSVRSSDPGKSSKLLDGIQSNDRSQ